MELRKIFWGKWALPQNICWWNKIMEKVEDDNKFYFYLWHQGRTIERAIRSCECVKQWEWWFYKKVESDIYVCNAGWDVI